MSTIVPAVHGCWTNSSLETAAVARPPPAVDILRRFGVFSPAPCLRCRVHAHCFCQFLSVSVSSRVRSTLAWQQYRKMPKAKRGEYIANDLMTTVQALNENKRGLLHWWQTQIRAGHCAHGRQYDRHGTPVPFGDWETEDTLVLPERSTTTGRLPLQQESMDDLRKFQRLAPKAELSICFKRTQGRFSGEQL